MIRGCSRNGICVVLAAMQLTIVVFAVTLGTVESRDNDPTTLAALKTQRQECLASPPKRVTLTQSRSLASAAYIIFKDCAILTIQADTQGDGTTSMDASGQKIEAVQSFPKVDSLNLSNNKIREIQEADDTSVTTLDISSNGIIAMNKILIPSSVKFLNVDNNFLAALFESDVPDTVTSISMRNNSLISLQNFVIGDHMQNIDISDNSLLKLYIWDMPPKLQTFRCQNCAIKVIAGLSFPSAMSLLTFDLTGSNIEIFEVANSSVPVLNAVRDLAVTTIGANCSDTRASRVAARSMHLCVLSDADFEDKFYVGDSDTSKTTGTMLTGEESEDHGGYFSNWMMLAMTCLGGMLVCIVGGVVFVVFRRRHKNRDVELKKAEILEFDPDASLSFKVPKYVPSRSTVMSRTGRTDSIIDMTLSRSAANFVFNDIRTDEDILQCRLLQVDVVRGDLLAQGGYGAVYLATFQNVNVVTKQLLPERARDKRCLGGFLDEIRLYSTLNHPKIVRFIGVTWSSLLDISLVMEYMPNGDLCTMLHEQRVRESCDQVARTNYSWFDSLDRDHAVKCKSLLALDIAEALVYLHSFESPIIHRDLKSKNVLLSETWEAKLTDFGISRELNDDETMTAEIGTVSWIAPEVLRGEQYSEKADVYSFGVILTELDTCRRPYADGIPGEIYRGMNNKTSNTQIAVLVSAGTLRPNVHDDCPRSVRKLVDKCLAFNPKDRPSAVQIHYELRHLEVENERLAYRMGAQ